MTVADSASAAAANKKGVLVVGGGPSGLAAALILARRGWSDITVVESRPSAGYYEPDKGFSYRINARAMKLLDLFDLESRLAELSVSDDRFQLTYLNADGRKGPINANMGGGSARTAYWLPRQTFLTLLQEEVTQHWSKQINVMYGAKCMELTHSSSSSSSSSDTGSFTALVGPSEDAGASTKGQQGWQPPTQITARLVIGADGLKSFVRHKCKEWDIAAGGNGKGYDMRKEKSGSTGLKYKVLSLPADFALDHSCEERARGEMSYVATSKKGGGRHLRLGLLPSIAENRRTANIITWPSHEVWTKKTGPELFDYLQETFPQIPFKQWLTPEECESFVNSSGGSFPAPQYCNTIQWTPSTPTTTTSSSSSSSDCGVALVGDAIHCFPPDLGQGVNSALEDLMVLDKCLDSASDSIAPALAAYQRERAIDAKALIRLQVLGYPWQYKQSRVREKLWAVNLAFRLLMSKIAPGFFHPQVVLLMGKDLRYSEILQRVNSTSRRLAATFGALALGIWAVRRRLIV